ncbi:MAG: inositol monophosphatase [Candidatus Levyibacteriota bacterium]
MNFSKNLQIAMDASRAGAKTALKYYNDLSEQEITQKEDKSVVSAADLETEESVKNVILSFNSEAKFITEESESRSSDSDEVWIIDPIDGSQEFTKKIDLWSILIAHTRSGTVTEGVCYFPVLDIMLYAEKGSGAFVNEKKVKVSKTNSLSSALMGFSPIQYFKDKEREILFQAASAVGSTRGFNSSYTNYCIATGKMDAFICSSHNKIWDNAPFLRIIEEAGGIMTDWSGKAVDTKNINSRVLASNGQLQERLLKITSG